MVTGDREAISAINAVDPYEDEIELMDYLKVIWRWKYLILAGTLACAIGAAIISLNMTKIYGISTVLQPGVLKVTEDGKTVHIDSPQNIKAMIETGTFNAQILQNIQAPSNSNLPKSLGFTVKIPKGTNALDVLYETPNVTVGLQIVNGLNNALLERYGKLLKRYQENYDNQIRSRLNEAFKVNEKVAKVRHAIGTSEAENESAISQLSAKISAKSAEIATLDVQNEAKLSELATNIFSKTAEISTAKTETETKVLQISNNISSIGIRISAAEAEKEKAIKEQVNREATIRAQIEAKKKQIHNLEQRISDVKREIGRISKNTDLMIEERNKFLSSAKREDSILASVMYTNTIQQNIGYLNTLRSTVNNTNHLIFQEGVGIERLENDIKDLNAQKENLEKQTRYRVEKLRCDIKDLEAQKQSSTKQTKSRIKNLHADIKDLEAQKESLIKQTKYRTETMKSEIKDFEGEKGYISGEIKSIEFRKNNIQNIQIIKPPESNLSPIKPKTRLNIMLAGVVGLFLTVFLAFFIEYISKYKNREDNP